MDMLQLVFAFVNAPLFATFLLGMFWRRTTGHGAFFGLLLGTVAAATHHVTWLKGGWLGTVFHAYHSEMAQNFWTAVWAWSVCFVATAVISLLTPQRKSLEELRGLVYSLTAKEKHPELAWYQQPLTFGVIVLAACVLLNILFW
jgi:SSS family solute:Na+ symporter